MTPTQTHSPRTFRDVLFVTDRSDAAETPVELQGSRERRFVDRLRGIAGELLFPTVSTAGAGADAEDGHWTVEVTTDNASEHAIDLAAVHGARLHVLYVIDTRKYDTSFESAVEPLEEEGEEVVDRVADEAEVAGVAVTTAIRMGRPADLVAEYVREYGVDLVVMNARNPTGMDRVLGSPTTAVVRRVGVPVYLVPSDGGGR